MSNEIATTTQADSFLAVIERVAMSPDIDVAKLEKMLDMQERVLDKNAEISFNKAMSRLQPLMPEIGRTSKADKHSYAKYEDIERMVRPLYTHEGFSVTYNSRKMEDGSEVYYGTLSHEDGHSRTAEICLPADTSGSKNAIQAKGSTISYAKRYLLTMLLNIVTADEDDDGTIGGSKLIDAKTAKDMEGRINALEEDGAKDRFLKYMKVKAIKDICARDYLKADTAIKAKEAAKKKAKEKADANT